MSDNIDQTMISEERNRKIIKGLEEGKTQTQIAIELNLSQEAVSIRIKKMRENGIVIPNYRKKIETMNSKEINKKIIEGLKEGKTYKQIAEELKLSRSSVERIIKKIKKQGIKIPPIKKGRRITEESKEINRKIIEGLKEGKTYKQIAEELKLSYHSVEHRITKMKKQGIEILLIKKGRRITEKSEERNRKIIEGLKEGKTYKQIAEELKISYSSVKQIIKKIKKQGIKIPPIKKGRKITEESKEINRKIIEGLKEGKTQTQIAIELKLSKEVIYRRIKKMRENGIEIPNNRKKIETMISEKINRNKLKTMISEERNRKIIEGLKEGKTQTQIAIELNLSEGAVSRRIKKMRKNGVEIPNKKNKIDDKEIFTESKSSTSQVARNTLIEYILRIKETKNATNDQIRKLAGYYGVEDIINSILSQEGR